jgi:hypothetical protein
MSAGATLSDVILRVSRPDAAEFAQVQSLLAASYGLPSPVSEARQSPGQEQPQQQQPQQQQQQQQQHRNFYGFFCNSMYIYLQYIHILV